MDTRCCHSYVWKAASFQLTISTLDAQGNLWRKTLVSCRGRLVLALYF